MDRLVLLVVACSLFACGDDDGAADAALDALVVDSGSDGGSDVDSAVEDTGADGTAEDATSTEDASIDATTEDAATEDASIDAAADAGADSGRTLVVDPCARGFGSCDVDMDCAATGCGGETCAPEPVASTCDCTAPAGSCGCVDGTCVWFN